MLHQRIAFSCPCCGNPIGKAAPIEEVIPKLIGHQQTIITALSAAENMRAKRGKLMGAMWTGAKVPSRAVNIFHQNIHRVRDRIAVYGWTILSPAVGASAGYYRLVPLEAGAC